MSIWVCGEVLIDLIPDSSGVRQPIVGGGPANTAKALARLRHEVYFIDGISTDEYGQMARKDLLADGVTLDFSLTSEKPTAQAIVTLDDNGTASYEFKLANTATFDFALSWLPDPTRVEPTVLHIGTLATVIQPGADALYDWAMQVAEFAPVVFDPNIRPSVLGDRDTYVAAVEKWVAISAVVKVSEDDLTWLYPNETMESVVHRWVDHGCALVVITKGSHGLVGYTSEGHRSAAGVKIDPVDTVGAGDTVGAVIVEAIVEEGLFHLRGDILEKVLVRAAQAAAITCARKGAQPPYKHELEAALEK